MKKYLPLILGLLMLTCLLTACGNKNAVETEKPAETAASAAEEVKEEAPAAEEAKTLKFGLSLPTQTAERWLRDQKYAEAFCEEHGIELVIQFANDDEKLQLNQCENLITQGVDVLLVASCNSTSAAAIVEKAKEAGIPVVAYERPISGIAADVFVQYDNVQVGAQQAQYVLDNVPEGGNIVVLGGANDANGKEFHDGQMSVLQAASDSGKVNIVMDQYVENWDPTVAMTLMENALTLTDNNIQGVVATNDDIAGAAIEAMAAQGLTNVPVSGQDVSVVALSRIKAGTQGMSVFKDISKLSLNAFEQALKLATGEEVDYTTELDMGGGAMVKTLQLTPVLITKDNLDVLVESGYYTQEELDAA